MVDLRDVRETLRQEEVRLTALLVAEERQQRSMGQDTGEEGPGEIGDDATELAEREKGLGIEGALERMLGEVRHALNKLDSGTYGVCDSCGQPIGAERLRARPQASLCMNCQKQREHAEVLHESASAAHNGEMVVQVWGIRRCVGPQAVLALSALACRLDGWPEFLLRAAYLAPGAVAKQA